MAKITRDHALKIVKKLGAEREEGIGKRHDFYSVLHAGKLLALFGIRRCSRRDTAHGHIPSQLHVSPHQARLLAQCPMSRDDWLNLMEEKGFL